MGGFGWVKTGKRVLHNFAHSRTCLHKPTQLRHMPTQARTCRHVPARPWNRLRRRASHCVNGTYIVGYALLSAWFNSSTVGVTIGGCPVGNALRGVPGSRNATKCVPYRIRPGKCYPGFNRALLSLFGADVSGRLGPCRQGIEVKRLEHRCEIAEETGLSRKIGRQRESPTGWRSRHPPRSQAEPGNEGG